MQPLAVWITELFADKPPACCLMRVDAGSLPGLSFGHVSRCLTLAAQLKTLFGCRAVFCMRAYAEGLAHVQRAGFETVSLAPELSAEDERRRILELTREIEADWYVVDLPYPDMDTSYFAELRAGGTHSLLIDDLRFLTPPVEVILNSSIVALGRAEYAGLSGTRCLLGPDYLLFDSQKARQSAVPTEQPGPEILVSFGGSDPQGLTIKALAAIIQQTLPSLNFTIILGPGFRPIDQVSKLVGGRANIQVVVNPPEIDTYMARCDLAICSGGQTLAELYCLGKPVIAIASAAHEAVTIGAYIERGLLCHGLNIWNTEGFLTALDSMVAAWIEDKKSKTLETNACTGITISNKTIP